MINIYSNSGKVHYGIKQLVLDTAEDLLNLKTEDLFPGSTIFIISTSKKYMLNSQKQWIEITSSNSGEGGGGTINPEDTYVYDGGLVH